MSSTIQRVDIAELKIHISGCTCHLICLIYSDQNLNEMRHWGAGYAHVGMCKLSGDHRLLAYTVDTKGSEEFTLYVKDLTTGQLLTQHTTEGVVSVEWARNEPSLFYTVMDHLMRPSK